MLVFAGVLGAGINPGSHLDRGALLARMMNRATPTIATVTLTRSRCCRFECCDLRGTCTDACCVGLAAVSLLEGASRSIISTSRSSSEASCSLTHPSSCILFFKLKFLTHQPFKDKKSRVEHEQPHYHIQGSGEYTSKIHIARVRDKRPQDLCASFKKWRSNQE